ncbi:MAG: hypothetical protein QNJ85_07635 [Gammaproteobacteria bacterium]|nr:hypothetical protein [Gammaproteobacteria bacterium]
MLVSPLALKKRFIGQLARVLLLALLAAQPGLAQTGADDSTPGDAAAATTPAQDDARQQTVRRLLAIRQALEMRRASIRELLEQLETADEAEQAAIQQKIAEHRGVVRGLTSSFENIAADGAVLRDLEDAGDKPLNWNQELSEIVRPLITSLRDATEKPRRIAELRAAIDIYQRQYEVARRATESVAELEQLNLPEEVATGLETVAAAWRARRQDIERSLEVARIELRSLEQQDQGIFRAIGRAFSEFLLGSGLTLLLALILGLVVWFVMNRLQRLLRKWRRGVDREGYAAKLRVLLYSYNLLTVVLVTLVVLSVFYARGDFLLLSLAILGLAMMLIGIWRFLPGYVEEARLLLNLGAAREGERVIYNGLPFRLASLNLYSELRNPELEGVIRLPLSAMAQLTSRPCGSEPWFPSRPGEYLLLPDGNFAQVLRQTVEQVQLKVFGSTMQMASADLLQAGARNLSRDGFGIAVSFGIDYKHQAIALDRVPERLRAGLEQAFADAGFGEDLKDLVVDFKEAAASSLDYLVYATFDGNSAVSYFRLGRLIQQTCVDICNREGWGIPFTQVTLHAADAGAAPALPASDTVPAS